MITDTITHEEAVIQHFMEDTDFADLYLQTVLNDGDADEIQETQHWYDEAKSRQYWSEIVSKAEQTAKSGHNLEATIGLVDKALEILKAAVPA